MCLRLLSRQHQILMCSWKVRNRLYGVIFFHHLKLILFVCFPAYFSLFLLHLSGNLFAMLPILFVWLLQGRLGPPTLTLVRL